MEELNGKLKANNCGAQADSIINRKQIVATQIVTCIPNTIIENKEANMRHKSNALHTGLWQLKQNMCINVRLTPTTIKSVHRTYFKIEFQFRETE